MSISPIPNPEAHHDDNMLQQGLRFLNSSLQDSRLQAPEPWVNKFGFSPNEPLQLQGVQQGIAIDELFGQILEQAGITWGIEIRVQTLSSTKHRFHATSNPNVFVEDIESWGGDMWVPSGRAIVVANEAWQRANRLIEVQKPTI